MSELVDDFMGRSKISALLGISDCGPSKDRSLFCCSRLASFQTVFAAKDRHRNSPNRPHTHSTRYHFLSPMPENRFSTLGSEPQASHRLIVMLPPLDSPRSRRGVRHPKSRLLAIRFRNHKQSNKESFRTFGSAHSCTSCTGLGMVVVHSSLFLQSRVDGVNCMARRAFVLVIIAASSLGS